MTSLDFPSLVVGILLGGMATVIGCAIACAVAAGNRVVDRLVAEALEEQP